MILASRAPDCQSRTITLPTGTLDISVTGGVIPLDSICDFAARRNPRRGFLFVSTVLGRYTPVPIAMAVGAQRSLADRIPASTPGPIVVLALAEAGVGLGAGVFAEYKARTGRDDVVFLHSTRHRCAGEPLVTFDESHSHAPRHRIYRPRDSLTKTLVDQARTLVLVDDETTTGRTFLQVRDALAKVMPRLQRTLPVVLTDWTGTRTLPDGTPIEALLHGSYTFTPAANPPPSNMPDVNGGRTLVSPPHQSDDGRFGVRIQPRLAPDLQMKAGQRVLVLGTGEYQGTPMRLARRLAASGVDAWFQATTRAPVHPSGPIRTVIEGRDNYGEDLPNYLYNFVRNAWDAVLLCQETSASTACPLFLAATGAQVVAP